MSVQSVKTHQDVPLVCSASVQLHRLFIVSSVCWYDLSLSEPCFYSSVQHVASADEGNRKNIAKETFADETLLKQACSRRGAILLQNKSHYLSPDQTAAKITPAPSNYTF